MERTKYVLTSAILLSLIGLTTSGCGGDSKKTTIVSTNHLVFSQQPPATAVAGQSLTPEIVVSVVDDNGTVNGTVTDPITITLQSSTGASLGGTATVNAVAGVARFSDLRVDKAGANNTLVATSAKQVPGYSAPFTVVAGNATQLRFVNAVNTGTPNVPLDPIQIELLDAGGNRATASTQAVTMSIVASNGAILGGATIIGASNGVCTFSSLTIDRAGSYQLIATANSISTTSPTFTVSAAPSPFVGSLSYGTQPTNSSEGGAIPAFTVELRDNFGALLTSASNPVTINLGTNTGGAALGGTLTVPAVNGVATFSSVIVDRAGANYRLTASVGGFNDALSNTFNVGATTARSLTFVTGGQPGNVAEGASLGTVQVQILNSTGGNANAANPVTIQLGANPGGATLSGTLTVMANGSGLATFNNLTIDRASAGYTLTASSGGLQGATSNAFTISPSTARQLAFTTQPSTVGQGQPMSTVRVALQTSGGAAVALPNVLVTLQLANNPTNAVLGGTLTVPTNAGGVAEFSDLTLSRAGTNLSFTATAGALTPATSGLFTVNATAADRLAFVGSITGVAAGSSLPTITVEVRNANNTAVIGAQDRVTLLIGTNAGGGTLRGVVSATANPATGQATFSNLSIDRPGTGYRIVAISGSLTAAESNTFDISATTALALRFFNPPGDVAAGSVINAPGGVTVEIVDANGARVTSATNQVMIALGSNPGPSTLSGTQMVNAVAGLATFKTLTLNTPAAGYTLAVSGAGLTGATSGTFDVTPATAARLGFVAGNQPQTIPENGTMGTDVVVEVQDSSGARVLGSTNFVTLHLAANPGGSTLRGLMITAQAVNGRATFSGLSLDRAAIGYVLGASSPGLLGALSSPFDVTAVLATGARGVDFSSTPPSAAEGGTFTATVQLVNSVGAPVIGASNLVTLQLGSNPSGAVLSGPAFTVAANGAGLATFTGLSIDRIGTYTLLATSNGLTSDISAPIAITAGAARELRFNAFAGAPEGSTLPTITVRITDANGATVTSATNLVTLAFASNPAAATLSGLTSVPAVGGVATFTGLSVDRASASTFSLVATSGALTPGISNDFAVTAATARSLAFTGPLPTGTAGNTLPSVTVLLRDSNGNLATSASNLVTLELGTNTAGGILRGTLTVAAVNGVAQFSDLSLDRAGTYTLHATAGGLVDAQSGAFSISGTPAGVSPVALDFTVEPTSTAEGSLINGGPPAGVSVAIVSSSGSTITGATNRVTISLASNTGGGLLFGPTSVNAVNGVATFSNLAIDRAGSYTLLATANGLEGDISASFSVTPAAARQLAFTVNPPASTAQNNAFATSVVVAVQDSAGGTVTTASNPVTLVLGSNPAAGTLSGTLTVNAINGLATFPGLSIDRAGAGYSLTAFSGALAPASTPTFAITGQTATQLAFGVQPPAAAEGSVLGAPTGFTVRVHDSVGGLVTGASNLVTLQLVNNVTGATLRGTLTRAASSGIATFDDVTVDRAGTYTLLATSNGLTSVISNSFAISAALAQNLAFAPAPSLALEGSVLQPSPIQVRIQDSNSGLVSTASNLVTISIASNPAGGTLGGTLTVAAVNGIASFNDLTLSKAGSYTLLASSNGLTQVLSGPFTVSPNTATSLVFSQEPTNVAAGAGINPSIRVRIVNASGATVTSATNPITLQFATNPGGATLGGPLTVNAVGGESTFTNVRVDKTGIGYQLVASSPGLTGATSATFDATGSLSHHLAVQTQPGSGLTENNVFTVRIRVEDVANNPVTGGGIPVTLFLANNPGGATLRGDTNVVTNNAGVAVFNNISIDKAATGYTLMAVSGGLPTILTNAFDVGPNTAAAMAFVNQPSSVNEGQVMTPTVRVRLFDVLGNPVGAGFDVTLVLASNPGGATLRGTLTVPTDTNGRAIFSDLRLDRAGTGYRLLALSAGLPSQVSDLFDVQPFVARDVAFTLQPPSSVDEGAAFSVDVQLRDGTGAPVSAPNVPVTIDLASNPGGGALAGTLTVNTNASGVASFTGLTIDEAGAPFQLRASSAGLSDGLSNTFTVAPALARRLAFLAQPVTNFAFSPLNQPGGVTVQVQDSNGDPALGQSYLVTLVLGRNTPNGILSGTLSQLTNPTTGVAAFTDLVLNLPANGYTFTAFASGLTPAVSTPFNILGTPPPAGTHLGIVQNDQPADTPQAAAITNITSGTALQVEILDIFNNRVAAASGAVTVQLGSNPANGILSGTLTVNAVNGVATFSDLTIDQVGVGYRLTFTTANLVGVTTDPFDITPSLADHLTFPSAISPFVGQNQVLFDAGNPAPPAIVVQVVDAGGTPVTDSGIPVTLAITTNPASPPGTLSGTTTRLTVGGVATFNDLSIDRIGGLYVLTATANGLGPAQSTGFSITPTTAASVQFLDQPTDTDEGATINALTLAGEVTVQLLDHLGNVVVVQNIPVTLAIDNNVAAGVMSGTLTRLTDVNGVAHFDDLAIDRAGAGYTLRATSGALGAETSAPFTINPTTPHHLDFLADVAAGQLQNVVLSDGTGSLTVRILNGNNGVVGVDGIPITLAITTNGGTAGPGTLHGTTTRLTVGGVAEFDDLSIDNIGTGYQLTATSGVLAVDTTAPFDIGSSAVAAVRFTAAGQPAGANQNVVIPGVAGPIQVEAVDQLGAHVAVQNVPVTVAITSNPNGTGAILHGTLTSLTDVNGFASFNDLRIDQSGNGYVLRASSAGLIAGNSSAFSINSSTATHLLFTNQPADTGQNVAISTPTGVVVALLDANNLLVATDGVPVTLHISTNNGSPAGVLAGTTTVLTVGGFATFPNLSIQSEGLDYQLTATSGALLAATSADFDITPTLATQLSAFTPADTAEGAIIPDFVVELLDSAGNDVNLAGVPVTVALDTNPSSGILSGTVTAFTDGSGDATFTGLSINQFGSGYTLRATAGGLTGSTSGAFTVTPNSPRGIVFVVGDAMDNAGQNVALTTNTGANGVRVQLVDGLGGNFSLAGVAVTASIGTQGAATAPFGALAGTTTVLTDATGLATFSNLSIDRIGTDYSLLFTSSGLGTASSDAFDITATTATQLAITGTPGPALQNAALGSLTVQIQDAANGNVTPNGVAITIAITTNGAASPVPGPGHLRGTTTKLTVNGAVTFNDLSIDNIGAGYVLTATADNLTPISTAPFAITPSAAAALRFRVAPDGSPAATPENVVIQSLSAGQVQVEALDQTGATVNAANVPVTLTLGANPNGASAVLRGTLTALTDATGVATFGDLRIDQAGNGYALRASSGALVAGDSSLFTITSSTATQLRFTSAPGDTAQNVAIAGPVTIELRDANNVLVPATGVPVTLHISTNNGTPTAGILRGTTTVYTTGGVAAFPGISIQSEGLDYQLTATSGSLLAVTSGDFDITPALATQLSAFSPAGAPEGVAIPSFVVELLDSAGNDVDLANVPVTVTIDTNPSGGVLSGTLTAFTDANGDATFTGLSIDEAGAGYVLRATAGGLAGMNSAPFAITANSARALGFIGAMDNAGQNVALTAGSNPVQVQLLDANGAPFAQAGVAVTAAIGSQGAASAPFGALAGTTTVVTDSNGLATFANLSIDQVGTAYSLLFTSSGLGFVSSDAFDITATTAVSLSFLNEPADGLQNTTLQDTVAGNIRVRVLDASSAVVSVTGVPVTIAISQNGAASPVPGPGTLSGTMTVLTVNGVATFDDLSIDNIGTNYRLTVTSGTLAPDTSADFDIGANTAAALRFLAGPPTGDPTTTDENAVIQSAAGQVQVEALDQAGAPVAVANIPVTLALDSNPNGASAVLRGTLTALTDASGVATFGDLRIDQAGNGYSLRASSNGLVGETSTIFSINSVTATQLAFAAQPEATVLQGQALEGAPAAGPRALLVELRDANGVLVNVSNVPVTIALTTNHAASAIAPGRLAGTTTRLTVGGVATFDDVSVDNIGLGYRLTATAGDLFSPETSAFDVTANQAVAVRFRAAAQPTDTPENAAINGLTGVVVELLDQTNTVIVVPGVPVTVGIGAANPGGGTLRGTLTVQTTATGEATFTGLAIDRAGVDYALRASAQGMAYGDSATFDVIAAVASSLAFVNQPLTTGQNVALAPITVELRTAANALAPFDNVPVTLHISTNTGTPPGVLGGTTTVLTVGGVATFPGLTIGSAGTGYALTATAGSLLAATSNSFDINQTLATQVAFLTNPGNSSENATIPSFTVELRTTAGAAVNLANVPVTVSITTNVASGGVLSGTLTVPTDANGDAVFTGLSINRAGDDYVLRATAGSLTAANSGTFDIAPNTPARLVAVGVMNNVPQFAALSASLAPVRVQVVDSAGNNVALAGVAVTAAIATQTGPASPFATLAGSTTVLTDASGLASFTTLSMDRIGTGYGLLFTSGALAPAGSTAFDITPSAARAVEFANNMVAAVDENATLDDVAAPAGQVVVRLLDHLGTPITAASTNGTLITIGFATNPGGGVLRGTLTRTTVAGIAVFDDLSITRGGLGYALVATCGTLVGDTSTSFTVNAITPVELAWGVVPSASTARGAVIDDTNGPGGAALTVEVRNALGGVVTTDNTTEVTVVLGSNPGSGVLGGTVTRTAVNGVATFNDLTIDAPSAGYRLTAFAGSLTPDTTATTFAINGPPANQLVFRHHPGGTPTGVPIGVGTGAPFNLASVAPIGPLLPGTLQIGIIVGGTPQTIRDDGHGRLLSPLLPGAGTVNYGTGAFTGTTVAVDNATVITATRETTTGSFGAGVVLGSITVEAITAEGLVDTAFTGDIVVQLGSNPGSAVLGGLLSKPAIAGQVTFNDLTISAAGTGYTLAVASSPLAGMTGSAFNVTPTNVVLSFSTPPPGSVDENAAFGAVVATAPATPGVPVSLRLGTIPTPGGVLSGTLTVVTDGSGVADFTGLLQINRAGAGYTLIASANGLTDTAPTAGTNVLSRSPASISIATQPGGAAVGATLGAPTIQVLDGQGANMVGQTVQLILASGPLGAALSGTTVATTGAGGATFANLQLSLPGTYTLWALVSGLTPVQTDPFIVSGSVAPLRLDFVQQPIDVLTGAAISPSISVRIEDSVTGDLASTATNSVTLVFGANPAGGVLGGTTLTVDAVGGVATFTDVRILQPGSGYRLTAVADSLYAAVSSPFAVNVLSFTSTLLSAGNQPLGLAAADRDGASGVDLVAANQDGYTSYTNVGTGVFTTNPVVVGAIADGCGITIGDIDGVSPLDVTLADETTNFVAVHDGGDGSIFDLDVGTIPLTAPIGGNLGPTGPATRDFVTADLGGAGAFPVGDQTAAGTFVLASGAAGASFLSCVAVGDVDGDTDDDVVAVSGGVAFLSISRQTTPGIYATSALVLPNNRPASWLELANVDQDGDLDVIITQRNLATGLADVTIAYGDGAGAFGSPVVVASDLAAPGNRLRPAVGDINGDGLKDLVIPEFTTNRLFIYAGSVDGTFRQAQTISTAAGPVEVVLADLDGNGDLDIAVTCYASDQVQVFLR